MIDFVDRMLGRSAGSVIRPLLPTLYEPITRGTDEPLPLGVFTESAGQSADAEPTAVDGLSAPQLDYAAQETPELPAPSQNAVSAPAAPQRRVEHPREAAPHPASPTSSAALAAPPHRSPADPLDSRARREQPELPGPSAPGPAVMPTPAHRTSVTPPVSVATHESFIERPSAFQQAFVQERARTREPDVHISIGRVEIKTAAPTAPPPRRVDSARRPQLTLDDYLKSRGS